MKAQMPHGLPCTAVRRAFCLVGTLSLHSHRLPLLDLLFPTSAADENLKQGGRRKSIFCSILESE